MLTNKNEIKKALYREKPLVNIAHVSKSGICYDGFLEDRTYLIFLVPLGDLGDVNFLPKMSGQLFIRYLISGE